MKTCESCYWSDGSPTLGIPARNRWCPHKSPPPDCQQWEPDNKPRTDPGNPEITWGPVVYPEIPNVP